MLKDIFFSSCLFELRKDEFSPPIHRVRDLVAPTKFALSVPGVKYLLKIKLHCGWKWNHFFIAVVRWIPINEPEIVPFNVS